MILFDLSCNIFVCLIFHCEPKVFIHAQTQVHIAASECLLEMVNLLKATGQLPGGEVAFSREFEQVYDVEKNEHAKSLLKRCIDILENLKKEHKVSS